MSQQQLDYSQCEEKANHHIVNIINGYYSKREENLLLLGQKNKSYTPTYKLNRPINNIQSQCLKTPNQIMRKQGEEIQIYQINAKRVADFLQQNVRRENFQKVRRQSVQENNRTNYLARPISSLLKINTIEVKQQAATKELQTKIRIKSLIKPAKQILNSYYGRPFIPPTNVMAYSYIIFQQETQQIHLATNIKTQLQIASLTKIMTCIVILRLIQSNQFLLDQIIEIGSVETNITGTTAELEKGDKYTVQQLLYGLMLPSGNDASLALACWGGKKINLKNSKIQSELKTQSSIKLLKKREAISLFVNEMNKVAFELGMRRTRYSNPHGLSCPDNRSTAYDLALLCKYAMKNTIFRNIVATKTYSTVIKNYSNFPKTITWQNTHKLLNKSEYQGIKTGSTTTAGGCLASYLTIQDRKFIIIVLKCEQTDRRFKETEIMKRWLMKKQNLVLKKQESGDF